MKYLGSEDSVLCWSQITPAWSYDIALNRIASDIIKFIDYFGRAIKTLASWNLCNYYAADCLEQFETVENVRYEYAIKCINVAYISTVLAAIISSTFSSDHISIFVILCSSLKVE